jgi:hypothetical protein
MQLWWYDIEGRREREREKESITKIAGQIEQQ